MSSEHLTHIKIGDLGEATLIVGDPARVDLISADWHHRRKLEDSREFVLVVGEFEGHPVSICSTGMGVGSTEICVIELLENGAQMIIRCGGCGAWNAAIQPGDIIVNQAMVRTKGLLGEYVPDEYPAVADPLLVNRIYQGALAAGLRAHLGIGLTTETYFMGQCRQPHIAGATLKADDSRMAYWQERGVINAEMESAVLFLLGAIYQVPVANCLVVHLSRATGTWAATTDYNAIHKASAETVLQAVLS